MPPSPSKMGWHKNFRKQSDMGNGEGGSYNFNFEERGKFSWEGLKRFARKIKIA